MFKIFDFLLKIITLPFTILSLPFKLIDWVFKIIGIVVLLFVLYLFGWIPVYNDFVDGIIPDLQVWVRGLKNLVGLVDKIPTDKIDEATKFLKP
jgi:hypothetical protein